MLSDPITLYKLMILYMLDHVNFPLTNSQLTDFFLDHEYTTYFTLQQALNELKEAGLIRMESTHNSSRYEITLRGRVLPIGGLKEKTLAARMAHMKKVLVPDKNRPDMAEISKEITKGMEIVFVKTMDDVVREVFV